MSTITVNAIPRADEGKGASRRLRRENLVPGVVYGGDKRKNPANIAIAANELNKLIENNAFFCSLLTLTVDGKEEQVIVKDLQRHPAKPVILHIDFQRVTKTGEIKIIVPVDFTNFEASAPAKTAAKFAVEKNTVEVICLPENLPEALVVDLSAVEDGQILHMSDIVAPEGVQIDALRRGADHDQSIGYVYSPRGAKSAG